MRWKPDEVDLWCSGWAMTRRKIHGIVLASMLEPKERLGKLKCTLGRVKEEAEGAAAAGVVNQQFPEVYTGMALIVHRCWVTMPNRQWMEIMDAQYVWREWPVKVKVPIIGIRVDEYWDSLKLLKAYLYGAVRNHRDADEFVPAHTPSPRFIRTFA